MSLMNVISTYSLFIYFIFGVISAYLANKEGKNPYLWFALGVLFGIFTLLIFFFLKHQKTKKAPLTKKAPSLVVVKDSRFWYYLDKKNTKLGPISFFKLQNLWHENKIFPNTYVWTENFKDWKFLKDIKEYKKFFQKNIS